MQEWFRTHPCPTGTHLNPESASSYLQHVSEASTKIGLGGIKWKHKKWKSYRDGWSPFMLANQAHYHFLLKAQRHLLGQHGYSKWSPSHVLSNLWTHTFTWEEAIHHAFCGDKDPEAVTRYLTTITHGPTFYRNLNTAPTKEFIASEISKVRSRNQTRRTQDKANNLTEYRQMLSNAFEQKQYGRIIKLLTGEFPPPWTHMTSRDLTANTSRTQSNAYKLRPPNSSATTAAPHTTLAHYIMKMQTGTPPSPPVPYSAPTSRTS